MRIAYTLEQCWHRVPGGTAVAALETALHLRERDGLGARRRLGVAPPPARAALARRRFPFAAFPSRRTCSTRPGTGCGARAWNARRAPWT